MTRYSYIILFMFNLVWPVLQLANSSKEFFGMSRTVCFFLIKQWCLHVPCSHSCFRNFSKGMFIQYVEIIGNSSWSSCASLEKDTAALVIQKRGQHIFLESLPSHFQDHKDFQLVINSNYNIKWHMVQRKYIIT